MSLLLLGVSIALAGELQPVAEAGTVLVAFNQIQQGREGTLIDLSDEGGQGRLFPNFRLGLDFAYGEQSRNRLSLIWQPLELGTRVVTERDWQVQDQVFARGAAVDVKYGFSFFRASWQRDLLPREDLVFAIGANLQFRTSSLEFIAVDGSAGTSEQEFGPVPSLLLRSRRDWNTVWTEVELNALPAPDFSGFFGFYELNARVGYFDRFNAEPYVMLRGFGGGFAGNSNGVFTDNQLLAFALLAGVSLR